MVFAPHPDDELLSAGGTILKYTSLGCKVTVVVATQGLGGFAKLEYQSDIKEKRRYEFERTTELLHSDFIELNLEEVDVNRTTVRTLTQFIREKRPQVILMPHYTDVHRSHRNLAIALREAIYHTTTGNAYGGYGKSFIPFAVYCYESPSCKFQYVEGSVFVTVDISQHWEEKKHIFNEIYSSQKEVIGHVVDWAEKTALLRGNDVQGNYGEAFIPLTEYVPLKILLI
ncbi:MAG: bacillithiol biosynthesis cysteine-adding enzyme BshC [Promethearchaeota archaeon CR_4]|nr:MAG: bacillithiol biosynthesis cysteine-adding enzyme BshC [Candidatus Lokiarchaeota archaeon CR_4]